MKNNFVLVYLDTSNKNIALKLLKSKGINLYKISFMKDELVIKIREEDVKRVKKLYKIKRIKYTGLKNIWVNILLHKFMFLLMMFFFLIIMFYTSIIVGIEIETTSKSLSELLLNDLDRLGIDKFTFKIGDKKLEEIENNLQEMRKEELEWIDISVRGMKYVIKVQPRLVKDKEEEEGFCNIVASKDGVVTKIISSDGLDMVEVNDSVHKGDVLISGEIKKDEEIKGLVCAKGRVYATTWYTIDIKTTKTYEDIKYKGKSRYNLLIKYDNKSKKLFKEKYDEYIVNDKKSFNIFKYNFVLQKEESVEKSILEYSEEVLNERINNLVQEKMASIFKGEGEIKSQKVLKKSENNSTIELVVFIVAEEQIGISSSDNSNATE